MRNEVKLNLLDQFECLGADCPATCCAAWRLPVYPGDLAGWREIKNPAARTELLGSVVENTINGERFHALRKYADGTCVNLNEDGLCKIQLELGHELLPLACQKFPRTEIEGPTTTLLTARLACPGVVALLVSFEPGDEFQTVPPKDENQANLAAEDTGVTIVVNELTRMVEWGLDVPNVPLGIGVFYIADVLSQITSRTMDETLDRRALAKSVGRTQEAVEKRLNDIGQRVKKSKIKTNKEQLGRLWKLLFDRIRVYKGSGLLEELEDLPIVEVLRLNDEDDALPNNHFVKLYNQITRLKNEAQKKYPKELPDLMRSYLRVTLMNNGFPWNPVQGNLSATFVNCVFPFAKVQLLLWMLAHKRDVVTSDDAVRVISAVERIMTHDDTLYDFLAENPEYLQLDRYASCFIEIV